MVKYVSNFDSVDTFIIEMNFYERAGIWNLSLQKLLKKLVDQGFTLEQLKIYFRKFHGRYIYHNITQHSPFAVFVTYSSV